MIVSQILYSKLSPDSLSIVLVALTDSQQVEFAVKHFDWGRQFSLNFSQLSMYLWGKTLFLSNSQTVCMTDSEIIDDRVNT